MRIGLQQPLHLSLSRDTTQSTQKQAIGQSLLGQASSYPGTGPATLLSLQLRPVVQNSSFGSPALNGSVTDLTKLVSRADALVRTVRGLASASGLSGDEQVRQQDRVNEALINLAQLSGAAVRLGGRENGVIAGLGQPAVANVDVVELRPDGELTVSGQVTQVAEAASLTVLGDVGGVADQSTTFELTGDRGTATFQVSKGESLAELAGRINQHGESVGATARVSGNNLVIFSSTVGRGAQVRLQQVSGAEAVDFNHAQVSRVYVSAADGSATFNGHIQSAAERAELRYEGGQGSTVVDSATIKIDGGRGPRFVAITAGESLDVVAARINTGTKDSGVKARVDGDDLVVFNEALGSQASVQVQLAPEQNQIITSGVNADQVDLLDVTSIDPGSEHTLDGRVLQSAARAELNLHVSDQGAVADSATFELGGANGTAQLSITAGESLADVASRINGLTETTGVTAAVSDEDILLSSSTTGSGSSVTVQLTSIDHEVVTSGVNSQQLTDFQVDSLSDGATHQLTGEVVQAAGAAELTYEGKSSGRLRANATFNLSGNNGSVALSVKKTDSVDDLAALINQHAASTGVAASVDGSTVTLRSTTLGTDASVQVQVTSGKFVVDGGNGDGTANGTDAVAVINGDTLVGNANSFAFSDEIGSYSFLVSDGFTGQLDEISVNSLAGQFDVTGGNGNGSAAGLDGIVEINGNQLTSADNRFTVTAAGLNAEIQFATDFQGDFDTIQVVSTTPTFNLRGGDSQGRATGVDAVAVINGSLRSGDGNRFQVSEGSGSYAIEFADGFTGVFDPISTGPNDSSLAVLGVDSAGVAYGTDAVAVINGRQVTGAGSRFSIRENGVEVAVEFSDGFQGTFRPLHISSRLALASEDSTELVAARVLADISQSLAAFGSGGSLAIGAESPVLSRQVTDRALRRLTDLATTQTTRSNFAAGEARLSGDEVASKASVVADQFRELVRNDLSRALASIDASDFQAWHQQGLLVDLLK